MVAAALSSAVLPTLLLMAAASSSASSANATLGPDLASGSDLVVDVAAGLGRDVVVVASEPGASSVLSLLARLASASVPVTVVTVRELPVRLHPPVPPGGRCDLMPEEPATHRRPLRASLYLVMAGGPDDVDDFLGAAGDTTAHCEPTLIWTDMYHRDNVFLYLDLDVAAEDLVLADKAGVKKHPYVGSLRPIGKNLMLSRYNIYKDQPSRAIWQPSSHPVSSPVDIFPELSMCGYTFIVACMPYDSHVAVDPADENEADPEHLFTNHDGHEVRVVEAVSQVLGFDFEFMNPADQMWGSIENGKWTGIIGAVVDERAHVGISGIGRMLSREQVLHQSAGFLRTELIFLSKAPGRAQSYFAIILPLSYQVWIAILVVLLVFQVCLWLVAKAEERQAAMIVAKKLSGRGPDRRIDLRQWSRMSGASWYTFGTLIGESITRDTKSEGAWGLRISIGVWLLFAFLVTAGYGGNLRAFLMNPPLEDPIDTLQKVADSGLPWEMGIYGEDVEMEMARSENPLMKKIWNEKIPVLGEPFAFEKVAKVATGKTVLIDWKNKLGTSILFAFTLPNGDSLVNRYELPIVYSKVENVHAFHPLNPWADRYSKVVGELVDKGLVLMFWDGVRRKLKERYGTTKYLPKPEDPVPPISMPDLLGLYLFFGCFMAISAAAFLVEFGLKTKKKKDRNRDAVVR